MCFWVVVFLLSVLSHSFCLSSERTKETLVVIGPAVFSGGFSTFLAFLLLANSSSYGFTLFFRVSVLY